MSTASFCAWIRRHVSLAGVLALLLSLAVGACVRLWWFIPDDPQMGDLVDYCEFMRQVLPVVAVLFCLFMLPPWRMKRSGPVAWLRRAVACAVLAAGAYASDWLACSCCVGYCEWAVLLLPLAAIAAVVCAAIAVGAFFAPWSKD